MSHFNVDAPDFVPGLNVHANVFKPTFSDDKVVEASAQKNLPNEKCDEAPKSNWEEEEVDEEIPVNNDHTKSTTTTTTISDAKEELGNNENNQVTTEGTDETAKYEQDLDKGKEFKKPSKKEMEKKVASQIKNEKEPVNVVFVGHVDAGKSTIGGHILYLTGMVDKRTLEKYEKEAKEKNRESWYLSWALDTNQEERDKGKTQEYGRADFETDHKHFTLLDAPGHKNYVPSMIGGAAQADLAILVISARKGEFETGFERGGQTREHAELVKTFGVKHLIVLINKMDDPTVNWSFERYKECCDKLSPFLRSVGFRQKTDLFFMPCSGLTGAWLKDPPPNNNSLCPWYEGPPLLTYLDSLPPISRTIDGPFRLPVSEKLKDMGMFVIGKIESGYVCRGSSLVLMPNRVNVEVMQLLRDEEEVESCFAGQNVKVRLKNVEEEDVTQGFVLCHPDSLIRVGSVFDAEIYVKEVKNIVCAGYKATMHIHCCVEWVELKAIICLKDKKTGEKTKINPRFVKQDQVAIARFQVVNGNICIDTYSPYSQMGRFTLREGSTTAAYGKVLKVLETSSVAAAPAVTGLALPGDQQAAIVPPVIGGT